MDPPLGSAPSWPDSALMDEGSVRRWRWSLVCGVYGHHTCESGASVSSCLSLGSRLSPLRWPSPQPTPLCPGACGHSRGLGMGLPVGLGCRPCPHAPSPVAGLNRTMC